MKRNGLLAIILARGGSKGIPRKNILSVAGKPLLAWTILAAQAAEKIDRVVVSTEDKEITQVARGYGAEVPFIRPQELAEDDTPDLPVFMHILEKLKEHEGYEPHLVVQLWATSPYRKPGDIDKAIELLESDPLADSVRSVTRAAQTPFKMWRRDKGKYLAPIMRSEFPELYEQNEPHSLPRQTLPEILTQTGYVNVVRTNVILSGSMYGKNIMPFFHDPETYTEVDSQKDFAHTEHVLRTTQGIPEI